MKDTAPLGRRYRKKLCHKLLVEKGEPRKIKELEENVELGSNEKTKRKKVMGRKAG